MAIKAAIFRRLSTQLAVPLQFKENGLVYTFLTTNGGNKRFLNAAKRENDARKSGVRKDSCVYEVKKRLITCSTRGCILHILCHFCGGIQKLLRIDVPVYFVAKCCAGKYVIYFLSHTELAKSKS